MKNYLYVAIALAVSAFAQGANLYECPTSNGRTVFSYKICGPDTKYDERFDAEKIREQQRLKAKQAEDERRLVEQQQAREAAEAERFKQQMRSERIAECEARASAKGLRIGMTKSELYQLSIWQFPDDVSKTTTARGVNEYWVYKCDNFKSVRLFIDNDRLTSIHQ